MTETSTQAGLVGEKYGSFGDLFAVTAFDWSSQTANRRPFKAGKIQSFSDTELLAELSRRHLARP